jgi:hypothetical protein
MALCGHDAVISICHRSMNKFVASMNFLGTRVWVKRGGLSLSTLLENRVAQFFQQLEIIRDRHHPIILKLVFPAL